MPSLRLNSAGPDVVALQHALAAAGFAPGDFDGVFGGGTEAALIAFQRSEGLVADGVAGPKTAKALGLDGFGDPPNVTGVSDVASWERCSHRHRCAISKRTCHSSLMRWLSARSPTSRWS